MLVIDCIHIARDLCVSEHSNITLHPSHVPVRPILLVQKARQKRKETGDDKYYAPMEVTKKTLGQQIENVLARPFLMLIQEPMLLAATVYMSVSFVLMFLQGLSSSHDVNSSYTGASISYSKHTLSSLQKDTISTLE